MVVIYQKYVVLYQTTLVCALCSLVRLADLTTGIVVMIDWLDAEEYRYNRRGDATALVTKWQLGEQYIFVSTSFVFVHGWRSGLQAKTLVRIAQRVGSIQMGFCCIYYFSFYLLFFRVLTFLSYVFGNVYENGFCLISSICFQP